MKFFETFTSNTLAGSGNQYFFICEDEKAVQRGRLFYRIFKGGNFRYSFLFSNMIDSTYSDGSVSNKNLLCDEWYIEEARVAVCDSCEHVEDVTGFVSLAFDGVGTKTVHPGALFATDGVELNVKKGQYLCLEISFRGKMIPYHEETLIPTFLEADGIWQESKRMPFPSMIGCDRNVEQRVAFLGDSITQGIGTERNSYAHWNACLAEMLGQHNAYWNLGLGFGRADDAASDGAWLFKAKQNDIVFVCFGVNDLLQGFSEEEIQKNLKTIVEKLKKCGVKVVLQTIPPFDYDEEKKEIWSRLNNYIRKELAGSCDFVYDNVPVLGDSERGSQYAKYGGHPNAEGCLAWAKDLYEQLKEKTHLI